MYYAPPHVSDAWAYLDAKHRPIVVFCTTTPLIIRIIDIPKDDPETFKARTHSTFIDITLWFLLEHPQYLFQAFVICHELLHQMCDHCTLLYQWQQAGEITGHLKDGTVITCPHDEITAQHSLDYYVNDGAVRMKLPKPTSNIFLHDPIRYGGWLTPENDIYVRLYQDYYPPEKQPKPNPQPQKGQGEGDPQDGDGNGDPQDGESDGAQDGQPQPGKGKPVPGSRHPINQPGEPALGNGEADVLPSDPSTEIGDRNERRRNALVQAFAPENVDKLCGNSPGDIEAFINKVYPIKLDWWSFIKPKYLSFVQGHDRSWSSPDLMWWSLGYVRPSRVSPRSGKVIIAVDTSGSVGARERGHFIPHIRSFAEEAMPLELIVVEWDTCIQRTTNITEPRQLSQFLDPMEKGKAGFAGSGGTNALVVDQWLKETNRNPDLTIFLTDLELGNRIPTGLGNSKDVVWVSTTHRTAPPAAGLTVRMHMN